MAKVGISGDAVRVVSSDDLDQAARAALRRLWADAYGDRFDHHDADHAYGGVHVIAYDADEPISHASAVPRRIGFTSAPGDTTWHELGYVEAVATAPRRQGEGIATEVMRRLHQEMARRWPAAMLSTGRATAFYERLGWERWQGTSYTLTGAGVVPDGEHGGLMILRLDPEVVPDRTVDVICEDRAGDAW